MAHLSPTSALNHSNLPPQELTPKEATAPPTNSETLSIPIQHSPSLTASARALQNANQDTFAALATPDSGSKSAAPSSILSQKIEASLDELKIALATSKHKDPTTSPIATAISAITQEQDSEEQYLTTSDIDSAESVSSQNQLTLQASLTAQKRLTEERLAATALAAVELDHYAKDKVELRQSLETFLTKSDKKQSSDSNSEILKENVKSSLVNDNIITATLNQSNKTLQGLVTPSQNSLGPNPSSTFISHAA